MEQMVYPGEFYRHFKDKLYQIITVAEHSETGEKMVVYQALYGDYRAYVRPLEMFLEEVDHDKYPQVTQRYRFEKVKPVQEESENRDVLSGKVEPEEVVPHPELLRFLEAQTYEEKASCLRALAKSGGQKELDSIYVALDMKPQEGSTGAQVDGICRYLDMQKRFDGGHLR